MNTEQTPDGVSEKLMTTDEVAALLRMSKPFVISQVRSGGLPAIKMGKYFRYEPDDIKAWLASQKVAPNE